MQLPMAQRESSPWITLKEFTKETVVSTFLVTLELNFRKGVGEHVYKVWGVCVQG